MATVSDAHQPEETTPAAEAAEPGRIRKTVEDLLIELAELTQFTGHVLRGCMHRSIRGTIIPIFYFVGVRSIPVIIVTGTFVGMVLAVQAFRQYGGFGLDTHIGGLINVSVVRELGPILAAVMLAGRVGGSMAAEIAAMRVTDQVDAISTLGVDPVYYLAVPRFLACLLLIPLLTILANFMGVMGGALICTQVYGIDSHHYWLNARGEIGMYDLLTGIVKPMTFGAAIAVISCYCGFNSKAGAEGVGHASTRAFVHSFIAILILDFILAMFFNNLYSFIWPQEMAGMP